MHRLFRPRSARFWVFVNDSWVKLTLRHPCQSLSYFKSSPTDEGFSYESSVWTHEGDRVVREWSDGGRDCDGRIDRNGAHVCHIDDLQADPSYDDGTPSSYHDGRLIHRPCWEDDEHGTRVRDEFAEAAGY